MRDVTPSVAVHCGIHFQTLSPCSSAVLYTTLYVGNPLEISLSAKAVKTSYRNTTMANTHVATTSQHCTLMWLLHHNNSCIAHHIMDAQVDTS